MGPLVIGALAQVPRILGGLFAGGKQRRNARLIKGLDPTYKVSQYAKDQLGVAQNAYQGRMAGAATAEQNILTSQANQFANVNRNATDSTQALAIAAGIGGQTGKSLVDLGTAEATNKARLQGLYAQALQNMTEEERRVFEDKLRKYQEAMAAKQDLMRSGMTNQQNVFNEIGSMGALYASGMFGDMGSVGGGSGGGYATGQTPEEMAARYTRRHGVGINMPRLRF
jgi:hypothetical protein